MGIFDWKSEEGVVIIEATFSLTIFIFVIITIYSMFHISLAQSRVNTAVNSVAKEISQYSYVYALTDLNERQSNLVANGGAAESILSDNLSQVNNVFDAFKDLSESYSKIKQSPENAESFLYYILNQGVDSVKGIAIGGVSKLLIKKHFGSQPDKYLKKLGIVNGINGLSFEKSRVFTDGNDNNIFIDVKYKVTVIKLLNINMDMNFEFCAKTRAWVGDE